MDWTLMAFPPCQAASAISMVVSMVSVAVAVGGKPAVSVISFTPESYSSATREH